MDLSKAIKLREVVFRFESWSVERVTVARQAITPGYQDLREISISTAYYQAIFDIGADLRETTGKLICGYWSNLDSILVRFAQKSYARPWESKR